MLSIAWLLQSIAPGSWDILPDALQRWLRRDVNAAIYGLQAALLTQTELLRIGDAATILWVLGSTNSSGLHLSRFATLLSHGEPNFGGEMRAESSEKPQLRRV